MKLNKIFNIKDKVIVITGASGLIGSSIAKTFIENGSIVIFIDKDISQKEKVISDIDLIEKEASKSAFFYELDLVNEDECINTIDEIQKEFHKIDVLINAAAIDSKFDKSEKAKINNQSFENFPTELIQESIAVNQVGLINITKAVCKKMLNQKSGNIINVASTYSLVSPNHNLYDFGDSDISIKPIDYVASKSFIPNFTRYIATFYAKKGIRCNTIVPHGIIENPKKEFKENWSRISPIGRLCSLDELNGPFIFLVSDASSYVNGATIVIDGGWTAW
tara:strand:+ start:497 stop:1330 length:834 start_codon:yes stop_codon:yes gene_type:complete